MFDWKTIVSQLLRVFNITRIYSRVKCSIKRDWIFYCIILTYIIIISTITIQKNNTFLTSGFDLGLLNQAFSTTLFDGRLFYETGDLSFNPGGSFFGVHFSPTLFLLLPFYAIFPSAENLLVMQTVVLALGAFPIYWMSRDRLGKNSGLLMSTVYFIYPPLFLLNLNDFHLEAFTSTLFLFSLYYFDKEEWKKFFVFFLLALGTLEFAPIIGIFLAFYGIWGLLRKRITDRRAALIWIVVIILASVLTFALAYKVKAVFNSTTSPLPSAFHHILSNPTGIHEVISINWEEKIFFVTGLFGSLAFLPLLAPEPLIMAFPWIFAGFSTSYQPYYSVYFQYTGFVIPFIFVALPKAIERLKLQQPRRIFYLILMSTIIIALNILPAQEAPWNNALPTTDERTELIHKILPLIPSDASILTQNDIFPHVSDRTEAYMYIPGGSNIKTNYILVDVDSPWYEWTQPDQFGERIPPSNQTVEGLENGDYGVYASAKSILLLKKGYIGEPALFIPFDARFNYETLSMFGGSGTLIEDRTSISKLVFKHDEEGDQRGPFWYGPYVNILPGLYKVTYAIKVDSEQKINQTTLLTVDVSAEAGAKNLIPKTAINASNIPAAGQWFNHTLFFTARTPTKGVEFRGEVWSNYSISIDYVRVEQLVSQPISETTFFGKSLSLEQGIVSDGILTNLKSGIITHFKGGGTFWHGPYIPLPIGNYTAKYWLKLDKNYSGTLLDLDVAINAGKDVRNFLTLSGSNFDEVDKWQSFEVKFSLQNSKNIVEFRGVNVRENAPISLRSIEVYPDFDQSRQLTYNSTFNYENLIVEQGINASGLFTHQSGNGTFWRGPYLPLPKGNYTARYWLKLNRAYEGVLLDVDVAANAGKDVLEFLTLSNWNFEKINKWQSFEISFNLQNETNIVELRGTNVRENAPISLLAVELFAEPTSQRQTAAKVLYSQDLLIDTGINVRNGTVWHGPYASLPKGNYIAKYWLRLDEPYNGTLLDVDVTTNAGSNVLTALTIHSSNFERVGKWQSFEAKFTLQNIKNIIELRGVRVRENAPISLLAVEVSPDVGQPTHPLPKTEWASKDLAVEQGKIANETLIHTTGVGTFWHGPYASLPKGNYIAKYWLRLDRPYNGILLDIDVSTDPSKNAMTFLTLSGSNFEKVDKWQSFEIKFTLQGGANTVEFRGVNVKDTAPISLRSIEVYPDTGQFTQATYNAEFDYAYLVTEQSTLTNGTITHTAGSGTMWRGPYASLPRGSYIARYWLRLDEAHNGSLLDIDVATDSGSTVLTSLTVHSSNFEAISEWQSYEMKFTLQNDLNVVELRGVNVRENAPISLRSVQISSDNGQAIQQIPKTEFNSQDLYIVKGAVTNGIMTHSEGNGTFWRGPYSSLPKGNYIAKYWLRLDEPYNGTLLDLDVAVDRGKQVNFLTLSGSNFEKVDKWQSFEIKFTLQNDVNMVELRGIYVRENASISLRSIEVYPDSGE